VAEDSVAEEAAGAGAGTGDAGRSGAAAAAAVVIGASTARGSAIASFSSMASKKKVKVDVERNDEENGRRIPPALAPVPVPPARTLRTCTDRVNKLGPPTRKKED
jgi:hypothetical protein